MRGYLCPLVVYTREQARPPDASLALAASPRPGKLHRTHTTRTVRALRGEWQQIRYAHLSVSMPPVSWARITSASNRTPLPVKHASYIYMQCVLYREWRRHFEGVNWVVCSDQVFYPQRQQQAACAV